MLRNRLSKPGPESSMTAYSVSQSGVLFWVWASSGGVMYTVPGRAASETPPSNSVTQLPAMTSTSSVPRWE